jgi:hypothetical protein
MHDLKIKRLSLLREINRIYRRCLNKLSCCLVGFRIASILSLALCFLYIILYTTLEDIMINQGWKRIPSSYKIDYQLSQIGASTDGRISRQNAAYKYFDLSNIVTVTYFYTLNITELTKSPWLGLST